MRYPWFRLWNDLIASDKVQMLAGDDFKAWVNLLVLANKGEPRGFLPSIERIAFNLRCSISDAASTLDRLIDAGLIDIIEGRLKPHDWDHWQPDNEIKPAKGKSTKRVREWRERKRLESVTCNTEGVTETLPKRVTKRVTQPLHETPVLDSDSEADSDVVVACNNEKSIDDTKRELPATIDTLAEEVEQTFPGTQFPGLVYKLCEIYLPSSVEWGFRLAIEKAWKGESMTVSRITGLVKHAQENKLMPNYAMRTPTRDPRPKSNGRPKTKREEYQEAAAAKLAKLRAEIGDDEEDDKP